MHLYKLTLACFFVIIAATASLAQEAELLKELPQTKEEFVASEKSVLATINWLESTPVTEQADKRKAQYALFTAWVINSPTVTIEVNEATTKFASKNSELLIMFMAGWTRYALQNNYSKDATQATLAGIRCAARVYKAGGLKKDKEMQKLIDMDEEGELEKWVTEQIGKTKKAG